jgi:hypothetical protein
MNLLLSIDEVESLMCGCGSECECEYEFSYSRGDGYGTREVQVDGRAGARDGRGCRNWIADFAFR